jgi:hypothetical protein
MRYKKTESPSEFWASASPGCWEWGGARDKDGYGQTRFGMKRVKAHRKAWELLEGPIPDGLYVLHQCNNPPCIRPDHLYLGTALDNGIDRKGRERPHRSNYTLSRAEVMDIRSRYESGTIRQVDLAHEYGVHQATISKIVLGKSYRFDKIPKANRKRMA